MSNATLQKAFDTATAGVITQGKASAQPASGTGSMCVYRLNRGNKVLKCAVGQLLSDEQVEKYDIVASKLPFMFGTTLLSELLPGVPEEDAINFLNGLQSAHDNAAFEHPSVFMRNFIANANALAERFELTPIKST